MLTGTTAYDSFFYESMILSKKMKSFSKKCLTLLTFACIISLVFTRNKSKHTIQYARVAQWWSTSLPRRGSRVRSPSRAFALPKSGFSLIFSLMKSPDRNRLDKLLHPLGTVLLHLFRHMTIHVQRERSGSVSKIFLHGFNVVTTFDTGNCVCVAQVVKADAGQSRPFQHSLQHMQDAVR